MEATEFIFYVADQARATAFYRHVLAAEPVLEVPGMTEFGLDGATLGLMPVADMEELLAGRIHGGSGQRCELCLRRADAPARAVASGGELLDGLRDRPGANASAMPWTPTVTSWPSRWPRTSCPAGGHRKSAAAFRARRPVRRGLDRRTLLPAIGSDRPINAAMDARRRTLFLWRLRDVRTRSDRFPGDPRGAAGRQFYRISRTPGRKGPNRHGNSATSDRGNAQGYRGGRARSAIGGG